jgi:hypothetical protein
MLPELRAAGFAIGDGVVEIEVDGGRYAPAALPRGLAGTIVEEAGGVVVQVTNDQVRPVQLGDIWIRFPAGQWPAELTARNCLRLDRPWFNCLVPGVHRLDTPTATARSSWGMVALKRCDTDDAIVLGVLGAVCETEYITRYTDSHKQGAFGLDIRFDMQVALPPGATRSTPPLAILGDDTAHALLTQYAALWADAVPPRPRRRVSGWNSWDFYGGSVRASDVAENAALLPAHLDGEAWAIIDDGWQTRWGEWTMNDRFPGGLAATAAAIRDAGAQPGIWSAPLAMYVHCPFARENRECCVRDADGNIAYFTFSNGPVIMLDPSHPKVVDYLRTTYGRIADAGFRYLKLDFSQYLFDPSCRRFHDPELTRMEIAARCIDTIRDAVGDDTIMASGTFSYELLAGRMDSARATSDIHLYWTHIWQCGMQVGAGYWMDGKLFTLDPDFLVARSDTTSSDEHLNYLSPGQHIPLGDDWWQAGPVATESELRVLATMIALTGGDFILGDRLSTLNDRGRAIIATAASAHCDRCAVPQDMWERACVGEPAAIWRGARDGAPVLGVINWSDAPRAFDLPALPDGARELWTDTPAPITDTITLPARAAALYTS